jgi:hypothetical protein
MDTRLGADGMLWQNARAMAASGKLAALSPADVFRAVRAL